jgi:methionyl-tRNA formyltransferase
MLLGAVDEIPRARQSPVGGSYYSRQDIDFRNPPIRYTGTAWQLHNSLRAFTFYEYQLPRVADRPIWRSELTETRSERKAGHIEVVGNQAVLSTRDFDVRVWFSPHEAWLAAIRDGAPLVFDDDERFPIDTSDGKGWTPLMVAAHHLREDACAQLLARGANINYANLRGTTALMYAVSAGVVKDDLRCAKKLLSLGAKIDAKDIHGKSISDYYSDAAARLR